MEDTCQGKGVFLEVTPGHCNTGTKDTDNKPML